MEKLIFMFDNLQIDETDNFIISIENAEKSNKSNKNKLQPKYNNLIESIISIIMQDHTFNAEIFNNIIICNNVLFGLNQQYKKGDNNGVLYKAILRLPEFYKDKLPKKNDPCWWDLKCAKFEELIIHLRNSSHENHTYDDDIKSKIINIASKIVQMDYEFKKTDFNADLLDLFEIARFFETYFNNKIDSFLIEEIQVNFDDYKKEIFLNLYNTNSNFRQYYNLDANNFEQHYDAYLKQINIALLKLIRGAQKMLILFGPYGFNALLENYDYINLNINEIFEFNNSALRYFALINLIELKLYNKNVNIINLRDYSNFIIRGSSIIN